MTLVDQAMVVLFLAWFNEQIVEYFLGVPLEKKFPELDRWWLRYVALASGFAWSWVFNANILSGWTNAPEVAAKILTGILVGAGSDLLHRALEKLRGK